MKKLIIIVLAIAMLFTVAACGGSDSGSSGGEASGSTSGGSTSGNTAGGSTSGSTSGGASSDAQTGGSEAPDAYFFTAGDVEIYMSAEGEGIVSALGEPLEYFEDESCAGLGIEKTYIYSGFELMTYQDAEDGKDKVYSIYFTDDTVETTEGICIGDSVERLQEKYPDAEENVGQYTAKLGNCSIYFIIKDGAVMSVEYVANDAVTAG